MRKAMVAGSAGLVAVLLALPLAQSRASSPPVAVNAAEIARALRGKACSTRMGAVFTFGMFGDYAYDGLWKSSGRYVIDDGIVTITLANGLERSFAISRHGQAFYMEDTELFCPPSAPAA